MAVFTEVKPVEAQRFLSAYGLPPLDAINGIAQGTENTNYKILAGGKRYILTLFEDRVAAEDLPYFLSLMSYAADQGLPAAWALADREGNRLSTLNGRPAALISFVPGGPKMNPDPDSSYRSGAMLARFHAAMSGFSGKRPNSMGPPVWYELIERAGSGIERFGDGMEKDISDTFDLLDRHWPKDLPLGTIHGDWFPDNILLEHGEGEVTGLIDFYFACTEFLAYDLAIAMNAYTSEEGAVDLENARALRRGYESVRPLSRQEKEALPLLLCGSALRFFLTRAVDLLEHQGEVLYKPKDPLPWLRLMRHHRSQLEEA
ncbi:MAG: homoserine kinase [Parvularcula sp.]|jgi:homoserine kinase type II|nr:homoserine kinase [Parvularcula sp.]